MWVLLEKWKRLGTYRIDEWRFKKVEISIQLWRTRHEWAGECEGKKRGDIKRLQVQPASEWTDVYGHIQTNQGGIELWQRLLQGAGSELGEADILLILYFFSLWPGPMGRRPCITFCSVWSSLFGIVPLPPPSTPSPSSTSHDPTIPPRLWIDDSTHRHDIFASSGLTFSARLCPFLPPRKINNSDEPLC